MYRVRIILVPGFQMLAHVLATETLRIANLCAGQKVFDWDMRGFDGQPVTASNGMELVPCARDWSGSADLALVVAGYDPPKRLPAGMRAYLARVQREGGMLGGVDTGTVLLAQLGYLDGHEAVLHHQAEAGFREAWPEIAVSDAIYCIDERRLTAAGGMATGDAMLAWVAQVAGQELADATAEAMAHGVIRPGRTRQRPGHSADPVLDAMQARMIATLDAPVSLEEIAGAVGLSLGALRRRCRAGLSCLPGAVYLGLRLDRALDLIRGTQMPVQEVALACGFGSHAGFSRAFRARYGVTPSALRAASRRHQPGA